MTGSGGAGRRSSGGGSGGESGPLLPLPSPLPQSASKRPHTVNPSPAGPLVHQSRRQRWTTPLAVARYFGVERATVCKWIRAGRLPAASMHSVHYTDDRHRITPRGRWRIFEADLLALLARMRAKGKPGFGPGFWQGGGK